MGRRPDGSYEFGDFDSENPQFHTRQREQQERQAREQVEEAQRRRSKEVANQQAYHPMRQDQQQPMLNRGRSSGGVPIFVKAVLWIAAICIVIWMFSPASPGFLKFQH